MGLPETARIQETAYNKLTASQLLTASYYFLPLQFFNFVALPMYQPMAQAFPGCLPMLEAVKANFAYWAEKEQQQQQQQQQQGS